MTFYVDGKTVENTEKLEGKMKHAQLKYFAQKFAARAMGIAERRSYGLGEVGYYINEDVGELIEFNIATEAEARAIASEAEDMMYTAEDVGATINQPYYSERFENERQVEKEEAE